MRGDRSYALVEAGIDPHAASVGGNGGYGNEKREPATHAIRASYELAEGPDAPPAAITVERPDRPKTGVQADERRFIFSDDRAGHQPAAIRRFLCATYRPPSVIAIGSSSASCAASRVDSPVTVGSAAGSSTPKWVQSVTATTA